MTEWVLWDVVSPTHIRQPVQCESKPNQMADAKVKVAILFKSMGKKEEKKTAL